jgi:hypothetical protein
MNVQHDTSTSVDTMRGHSTDIAPETLYERAKASAAA